LRGVFPFRFPLLGGNVSHPNLEFHPQCSRPTFRFQRFFAFCSAFSSCPWPTMVLLVSAGKRPFPLAPPPPTFFQAIFIYGGFSVSLFQGEISDSRFTQISVFLFPVGFLNVLPQFVSVGPPCSATFCFSFRFGISSFRRVSCKDFG